MEDEVAEALVRAKAQRLRAASRIQKKGTGANRENRAGKILPKMRNSLE
jgi:hypothetical protein